MASLSSRLSDRRELTERQVLIDSYFLIAPSSVSTSSALRNESLEECDNLPDPDVLAQEIVEELDAALE
jgi:hypothetical protein